MIELFFIGLGILVLALLWGGQSAAQTAAMQRQEQAFFDDVRRLVAAYGVPMHTVRINRGSLNWLEIFIYAGYENYIMTLEREIGFLPNYPDNVLIRVIAV